MFFNKGEEWSLSHLSRLAGVHVICCLLSTLLITHRGVLMMMCGMALQVPLEKKVATLIFF